MKVTKRGYNEIVSVIKRLEKGETKRMMWAKALGDVLRKSNPNFDDEKWFDAIQAKEE